MEQRPLRLGDIVDDYCPRERRITNHAIVAIVEDAIRQTRCSTCDTEHVYKRGREPLRRRKDAPALVDSATSTDQDLAAPTPAVSIDNAGSNGQTLHEVRVPDDVGETPLMAASTDADGESSEATPRVDDGFMSHRRLIRASLPRIEGEPPVPRPIPEFTMHQRPSGRHGHGFRFGQNRGGNGNGNGNFSHNRGPQGERNGNRDGGASAGRSGRHRGHGKRPR
jgi:hypothetical protein